MEPNKSIAILAHRIPYPPNKGEKIRTYYQIKELVRNGFQVAVFCPLESEQEEVFADELAGNLAVQVVGKRLPLRGLRLLKGFLSGRSLSEANFYSDSLCNELNEYVRAQHPKAVIFTASSLLAYRKVLTGGQIHKVMDFIDVDSDKWLQYSESKSFPMSALYRREHFKVKELECQAAELCEESYLIAEPEVKLFKEKVTDSGNIKVLGNGLDMDAFYPRTDLRLTPPVLLFAGVMDYEPNIDAVVWFVEHCWPTIRKEYVGARFIIAGMNPVDSVRKLTEHKGVEVTGFVDDILAYFHQATVFVAPFRLARGVQNKVLQAFACSLPVVSTSMGAEGIDCVEGRHFLVANSASEFIDAVIKVMRNQDEANRLADEALALIKDKYSWEGQLSPLIKVLENCS